MRIIRKAVALIAAAVILLSALPHVAASSGFDTYAAYVAKYRQFINDSRWKAGTPWKDGKTPEHGLYKAWGCAALASDFEYYMYGTYGWKGTLYRKAADISTGDIVKISDPHWFIILERDGEKLYTAEKYKDQVYITDSHYRVHDGVLQKYGYYNSKGKWVYGWTKCSFEKGYHYLDIEQQTVSVEWDVGSVCADTSETNAQISLRAELSGAAAKDVSAYGSVLYGPDGETLGTFEYEGAFGTVDMFVVPRFDFGSQPEAGLAPGSSYCCSVYLVIAGDVYTGPLISFSTQEPAPVITYITGDIDNNGRVDSDDAVYLMRHTLFSNEFLINQPADFDGDGTLTSEDVLLLLKYILYPGEYQLN